MLDLQLCYHTIIAYKFSWLCRPALLSVNPLHATALPDGVAYEDEQQE